MQIKTSSREPRPGHEPRSLDSKSGVKTTRLKGPDQLDWSFMYPIYLDIYCTSLGALLHSYMVQ